MSLHTPKRFHEQPGHFGAGQIAGGEDHGDYARAFERASFVRAIANSRILREDDPASPTDFGEPFVVGAIGPEVGIVDLDASSCVAKSGRDLMATDRAIHEERRSIKPP